MRQFRRSCPQGQHDPETASTSTANLAGRYGYSNHDKADVPTRKELLG
jgi:hypothetical protein